MYQARLRTYSILVISLVNLTAGVLYGFGRCSVFLPRSQSVDAARELMGWQKEVNLYNQDCATYWSLSLTPVYTRSFNAKDLSDSLLGASQYRISGSQVGTRTARDIFADYLGLPADFQSEVCFRPRITNFIFDIDFYLGLDSIREGFYIRIHAPIVHVKQDLNLCERILTPGTAFYPAGYLGSARVVSTNLAHSFEEAMRGVKINSMIETPLLYGDVREPLNYGKIFGREVQTRLSDLQLVFGNNFFQDTWYHVGLNLRVSAPTGSRICSEFLFQAIVGNGHHWEVGAGLTSHVDVWTDCSWSCSLYLDANITHLCSDTQLRSYEFKHNCPGSRYMLLEYFNTDSSDLFLGVGGPAAPNQYAQQLVPAINRTTLCTSIEIPAQADIVAKCAFFHNDMEIDFGYNLWMRSAERIVCRNSFASGFALKGDAQVYGFDVLNTPTALNVTQHQATLRGGQGQGNFVSGGAYTNANADSPIVATNPGTLFQLNAADSAALGIAQLPIMTSNPAVLLTDADIDERSGLMPRSITNKLFVHVGNRWPSCPGLIPYLGLGFEVEFATASTCNRAGLNQWGIIFKTGFSY